ncbi:hypothetical protein GCM10010124_36440 [Pilimelia terevasa]|uniref:Clp R domain-containing protein n=1 Tax=Pilimelia terevasa TaxID=53372 RepID=A0A8J3BTU1_9ACTN|nr:Clp protease N-terminal domain-containing protein [Pilimelia terevasa]GGK40390.1 hypothetical protein GCM10010124_36440 [Pilimelia terevasa]
MEFAKHSMDLLAGVYRRLVGTRHARPSAGHVVVALADVLPAFGRQVAPLRGRLLSAVQRDDAERDSTELAFWRSHEDRERPDVECEYSAQAGLREATGAVAGRASWDASVRPALTYAANLARESRAGNVGPAHMLAAFLLPGGTRMASVLAHAGVTHESLMGDPNFREVLADTGAPCAVGCYALLAAGALDTKTQPLSAIRRRWERARTRRDAGGPLLHALMREAERQALRAGQDTVSAVHLLSAVAQVSCDLAYLKVSLGPAYAASQTVVNEVVSRVTSLDSLQLACVNMPAESARATHPWWQSENTTVSLGESMARILDALTQLGGNRQELQLADVLRALDDYAPEMRNIVLANGLHPVFASILDSRRSSDGA